MNQIKHVLSNFTAKVMRLEESLKAVMDYVQRNQQYPVMQQQTVTQTSVRPMMMPEIMSPTTVLHPADSQQKRPRI
jgi:hypothetical protein